MESSDTARMGIIRRARESTTPLRTRYSDVRQSLRGFLTDQRRRQGTLLAARQMFEQRSDDPSLSDFQREDARLSLDVLDSFDRMQNQLGGLNFEAAPSRMPMLNLAGVDISVNVDLLVVRPRGTQEQVGGAIFRFTKADDETDNAASKRRRMGQWAANLVQIQVRDNLCGDRDPHYELCLSVDVQFEEVTRATRSLTARRRDLENACRFISAMWDEA